MSYVSRGSRASNKVLHRIGFDVDTDGFVALKVIPYGLRTKILRRLIAAVLIRADEAGEKTFFQVAAGNFTLEIDD